jgi:hypothetical protein
VSGSQFPIDEAYDLDENDRKKLDFHVQQIQENDEFSSLPINRDYKSRLGQQLLKRWLER